MKLPKELGEIPNADVSIKILIETVVRDCAKTCEQMQQNPKWAMTIYGKKIATEILHRYGLEKKHEDQYDDATASAYEIYEKWTKGAKK